MPWGVAAGAAISAGAGAAGSAGQKGAASDAADAQSAGIQRGIGALTDSYRKAQGYQDPYYQQGRQVDRRLAQQYGIIPPGLTAKERKKFKKNPRFNAYKKSLASINAKAPGTELSTIGPNGQMYNPEALPDLSRFNFSGQTGNYNRALGGITKDYTEALAKMTGMYNTETQDITGRYNTETQGITNQYSDLAKRYDPSGILEKYDVANLGDRVNVEQDPGYQFRKQQGEEAQRRQASARGTLQGGGFAKDLEEFSQGLASQEYANAYARLFGENETGFGRAYDANQRGYGREVDAYGRAMEGNQIRYGRDIDSNQMRYGRDFDLNQTGFGRAFQTNETQYGRDLTNNQLGYNRALGENEIAYGRGMDRYGRASDDYGRQLQMLGLQYEPYQRMSDRGFQAAGGLSDMATGYGGNLANLFSQQGQAQAQGITGRAAAQAQLFGNLGQLGNVGLLAGMYGAQGGGFGNQSRNSFAGHGANQAWARPW